MIPKALFISFLSVSLPGQHSGVPRFDVHQSSSAVLDLGDNSIGTSPVVEKEIVLPFSSVQPQSNLLGQPQQPNVMPMRNDYRQTAITKIDFDKLPAGDWDPSKRVQDKVCFFSATSGLRIYKVSDAFPRIGRLPHGGTNALGNFPFGQSLGIRFADGPHKNVTLSFALVDNERLQGGFFQVSFDRGGVRQGNLRGQLAGGWATASSGSLAVDTVSVHVQRGGHVPQPPSGAVLIEYAEYESNVASRGNSGDDAAAGPSIELLEL